MTILEWFSTNWLTVLGGGSISGIVGYFLGGKKKQEQEIKKSDVEINSAEVDYAVKVQELYESLLTRVNAEKEDLKIAYDLIVADFKNEKEYFRDQIEGLRNQASELQNQFNTIQLAYAREVEMSQNWEKLHRELTEKHNELEKAHEELKMFCNELKQELDKYKKKQSNENKQ
jgi:chromosome segregation ATPase